jgi:4-hydroxy-tetrahydrodipicolinate synthase
MFKGSLVALITPFKNGAVDEKRFQSFVEWQIAEGTHGVIPCGTTGESPTLSHEEHKRVVELTVEVAKGRIPVIAGTGSNSTAEAIRLTAFAREVGADGALLISPYYNKPTQEGIFKHYKMVAASVDLPLLVYNIPGRTGSNILPETFARLCEIKTLVGVKEASGSMDQISEIRRLCGDRLTILSGDDPLTLPMMALGAKGAIAVVSNVMPKETHDLIAAALANDYDRAREIHYRMLPLVRALFSETNPIPLKQALAWMGKCRDELRMPLTPMSPAAAEKLRAAMKELRLI